MTTGAIIFAYNNSLIDYVKIAEFAATRVKKFLDIPVSIITDSPTALSPQHPFDSIISVESPSFSTTRNFNDGNASYAEVEWKNLTRNQVYDLTPYDTTLVIDSDYILNSSVLKPALIKDCDFQIYRNSFYLDKDRIIPEFEKISSASIPFYWATVFIFKKNHITQQFFTLVSYIKENWPYFRLLYKIGSLMYRNDYAFSIAIHIMNGNTSGDFAVELPGTMTYILDSDMISAMSDTSMQFLIQNIRASESYNPVKTENIDVHVMNKLSLLRVIENV